MKLRNGKEYNECDKILKIKFEYDDCYCKCWEHPDEGWASAVDRRFISKAFRKLIEQHSEFEGWECSDDDDDDVIRTML